MSLSKERLNSSVKRLSVCVYESRSVNYRRTVQNKKESGSEEVRYTASVVLSLLHRELIPSSLLCSLFIRVYPIILSCPQHLASVCNTTCVLPTDRCSPLHNVDGFCCPANLFDPCVQPLHSVFPCGEFSISAFKISIYCKQIQTICSILVGKLMDGYW